jgi:hypothetical protein
MKSKPILFSTPMVQAILEGRKTQTRRIVKPQPKQELEFFGWKLPEYIQVAFGKGVKTESLHKFPFGQIDDVLWVRETFFKNPNTGVFVFKAATEMRIIDTDFVKWKPSIFMPKEIARIWLKITDIRVERLNKISKEDAIAEGIDFEVFDQEDNTLVYENYLRGKNFYSFSEYQWNFGKEIHSAPVASYCSLWESTQGDGSWNNNPWVWVIEFERIEKPSEV